MSRAIPPLPNTPSWRGSQLKHRTTLYSSVLDSSLVMWHILYTWNWPLLDTPDRPCSVHTWIFSLHITAFNCVYRYTRNVCNKLLIL